MKNNLIMLAGLPGTGKTFATKKLYENLEDYKLISQNDLRREMGMRKMPKTQDAVLRQIDKLTADALNNGRGVIIDSVNRYLFRRHQLYGVASCCDKNVLTLEVTCSAKTAKQRIRNRPDGDGLISDPNDTKVYDKLAKLWEDISLDFKYPGEDHVSYMTYNSETNQVDYHIIGQGMKRFANQVSNILTKK